jgi:nitronate monooxygenase
MSMSERSLPGSAGAIRPAIGQRDGIASIGQFSIDTRLSFALAGDLKKGLFFRGSGSLQFGAAIRPVAELMQYFLTGTRTAC